MSTRTINKAGRVLKTEKDTGYHENGTGPRDADGKPISMAQAEEAEEAEEAEDGAAAQPEAPSESTSTASDRTSFAE
jgi:hypothetical protein